MDAQKETAEKSIVNNAQLSVVRLPEKIAMGVVFASLFVFGALFFLLPKKTFSENENRYLARFPAWNVAELTGGVYTGKVEDFVVDHFPARDRWMALAAEGERLSGKRYINGVYLVKEEIAKDGARERRDRLIDDYTSPEYADRAINSFVRLSDALPNDVVLELMLAPTAEWFYQDELPAYRPRDKQLAVVEEIYAAVEAQTAGRVMTIDVLRADDLRPQYGLRREELYFRTDHHWTVAGAYVGYLNWLDATRGENAPFPDADKQTRTRSPYDAQAYARYYRTVSDNFYGTTWSKLNDPYFAPDNIDAYFDPDWKISVTYADTGVVTDTPYNEDWLSKKDQYSYFLDGIHPLVIVENNAAPEGAGAIAIVKDSYANCMIPFMIGSFRTMYIFDTRYYREGVSSYIAAHEDITEALILYNLGTMDGDAGIGGIF